MSKSTLENTPSCIQKRNSLNTLLERENLTDEELKELKDEYMNNHYFRIKMDNQFIKTMNMQVKVTGEN